MHNYKSRYALTRTSEYALKDTDGDCGTTSDRLTRKGSLKEVRFQLRYGTKESVIKERIPG